MAKTWTDGSDNWNTATDWGPTGVPQPADDVTIAQGDPQITANVGTVNSVTDSNRLDLTNGGALTTTATFTVNANDTLGLDTEQSGQGGSMLTVGTTLSNSGTIIIGPTNSTLSAHDSITATGFTNAQTGTLDLFGSTTVQASFAVGGAAGFGRAGILTGSVNLYNDSLLQFGSGQITSITAQSQLSLYGAKAILADAGATTSNSALTGLTSNAGSFYLQNGTSVSTTAGLSNSGLLSVDSANSSQGGSSLAIGGLLTNSGTVNIGPTNSTLSSPDTVTATGLTNFVMTTAGTINITGSTSQLATLNISAAAGLGNAGILSGTVNLTNDSLLEFASGQITNITAQSQLALNGANAFVADASATTSNSALAGLVGNAGSFYLQNGSSVTTTAGLTNSGLLSIDNANGNQGSSSFKIGGLLTNSGTLNIGPGNQTLTAADTLMATGLTNFSGTTAGTINVTGSASNLAEINLSSAAGFGRAGTVIGTVNVSGDALIQFTSGQITTINSGGQLSLNGANAYVADATAGSSNSALAGLTSNAGNFYLQNGATVTTTAGLTNTGLVSVDNANANEGGSSLTLGGALTNSGTLNVGPGNATLSAPVTVTTTALSNTGAINLTGSAVDPRTLQAQLAEINVTGGVAGFGTAGSVTGQVNLSQDALIQFQSGQITTIAANSQLSLNGADAYIADAGATTANSALTGLTSNAGNFYLQNGASVTTTTNLTNSGLLSVDNASGNDGGSALAIGGTLTNSGTLSIGPGNQTLSATTTATVAGLSNSGTINVYGSAVSPSTGLANTALFIDSGTATGSGTINLGVNASVELGGASSNSVAFGGIDDVLKLDTPAAGFTGTITGFGASDTLDLAGEAVSIKSYDGTTLTVATGAGATQSFALAGPAANGLAAVSDGAGGTDIVVCFTSGTRIGTARGDVAVEGLVVGDLVATASGRLRPIRWIGHRDLGGTAQPLPFASWPVRILAGAFGIGEGCERLPRRDLSLSPGHPVLVGAGADEVLVPIMCLINGTTIERVPVAEVTYWHIELDEHDILLAEGLPAESYLDWGDRPFFAEAVDHALVNPDFVVPGLAGRCRLVALEGPVVEAERRRLDTLFAMSLVEKCAWPSENSFSLDF